jgi:hypothetical protein
MEMVTPSLPLRKRSTNNYTQLRLFDTIDIKEQIEKNKSIKKCGEDKFLYALFDPELYMDKTSQFHSNNKQLITVKPKFDLNISYENQYGKRVSLQDEFYIVKLLGQGSFGMVLKVYDGKIKRHAALKIIKKLQNFNHNEEKNLMKFKHHNIVEYYRSFESDEYSFILMELMEGGTLKDLIIERYVNKNSEFIFNEEEAAIIMKGIINGLNYMHDMGMSHRDIKPGK